MVLLAVALLVAACGPAEDGGGAADQDMGEALSIVDAWARPADAGDHSAAYMTIVNEGGADVAIVDASAPVGDTELHESVDEDGVHRMDHVESIVVPAGEAVELNPGGLHIMLMNLVEDLEEGDEFEVTLVLDSGDELQVPVEVLAQ